MFTSIQKFGGVPRLHVLAWGKRLTLTLLVHLFFFCPFVTPADTLDINLVIFLSGTRVFRLMVQINVVFVSTSLRINGRGMLSDMNQRH